MPLLWKNTSCSEVFLALVDESVKDVENRLLVAAVNLKSEGVFLATNPSPGHSVIRLCLWHTHAYGKQNAFHIPTELNDCLMKHCLCIAVSRNTNEGASFRNMECVQYSVANSVYNIAAVLRPVEPVLVSVDDHKTVSTQ
eukprot:Lankesteria_metandrocarpae@DN4506_c0_g1_i2.p1